MIIIRLSVSLLYSLRRRLDFLNFNDTLEIVKSFLYMIDSKYVVVFDPPIHSLHDLACA